MSSVTHSRNPTQTDSFSIGLADYLPFPNADLPSIKIVSMVLEGFFILGTFEALIAFAGLAVLVGFRAISVGTRHPASPDSSDTDDESQCWLSLRPFKI
ncbi:MAG: hypothetical protein ACFB0E_19470 [Leptolyngbyaceae cyanobacterium]